jgi:hypothetical protein
MLILFHLMTPIVVTPEPMCRRPTTADTTAQLALEASRAELLDEHHAAFRAGIR